MSRVVVIGGGVVGLSCAYHLARQGHRVVVLDRSAPGGACSSGNLGWIVPALSEPLPAPGLGLASLKWMLQPDSPLYISPRFALTAPGWLWRFWKHCNQRDYSRGFEAVAALNARTLELYDQLLGDGVRFELHRDGLLFVFLTPAALDEAFEGFHRLTELGLSQAQRLSRDDVLAMESMLSRRVVGGVMVSSEGHVRPETLCAGLVERIREMGGVIRSAVDVIGVTADAKRVTAVRSAQDAEQGDAFVIAAGAWSGRVASRFGFRLPVEAGKGYSVTVPNPSVRPTRPLYLYERRVGLSPFDDALRFGGTMELSGINTRVVPSRVAAIRRAAADYLPRSDEGPAQAGWTGMRPLTPDGLPAIGRAPGWDNVYVATGHAMLGVTLAAVTGIAISELVTTGSSSMDLRPFDPARFHRRGT